MNPETVNALHVYPVNPVTDIETLYELSACSVSPNVSELSVLPVLVRESVYELSACPVPVNALNFELSSCPVLISELAYELSARSVVTRENIDGLLVFPTSVLETVYALSVFLCLSFS